MVSQKPNSEIIQMNSNQKVIPCLEILSMSGRKDGDVTLRIDKSKGIIDLSPWFEGAFNQRLESLKYQKFPLENYRDIIAEKKGDYCDFSFNMNEFGEAFFPRYNPSELASFLKPHFLGSWGEDFVKEVENFEKKKRVAEIYLFWEKCSRINSLPHFRIMPRNFSVDDLEEQNFPRSYYAQTKNTLRDVSEILGRRIYENEISGPFARSAFQKIRKNLLEREPAIVLYISDWNAPRLDYFKLIERYHLDTSNLSVEKVK